MLHINMTEPVRWGLEDEGMFDVSWGADSIAFDANGVLCCVKMPNAAP
jgi:hypothetical protein